MGSDPWTIEPAPTAEQIAAQGLEPEDVYDYLVDALGFRPDEAERLVGGGAA